MKTKKRIIDAISAAPIHAKVATGQPVLHSVEGVKFSEAFYDADRRYSLAVGYKRKYFHEVRLILAEPGEVSKKEVKKAKKVLMDWAKGQSSKAA